MSTDDHRYNIIHPITYNIIFWSVIVFINEALVWYYHESTGTFAENGRPDGAKIYGDDYTQIKYI